jgi:DNA-binding MarR family transcriptional regulator
MPKRQDAVNARTAAGDAFSVLAVQVMRLAGALTAAGDGLARPAGQTSARWRVLAAVEQEPLPVAAIARAWSLARQSVQRVADDLERDGLIVYVENPAHRRAQLVQLTSRGRSTLGRIQAAQREWANAVGAKLGVEELRTGRDVLARTLEAVKDA